MADFSYRDFTTKIACMLTRVIVLRLGVNNFNKNFLLACSKWRDPGGNAPPSAENRVIVQIVVTFNYRDGFILFAF